MTHTNPAPDPAAGIRLKPRRVAIHTYHASHRKSGPAADTSPITGLAGTATD